MNTLSHLQPIQPAMRAVFPSFFPSYLSRPGCYYCYNYVSTGLPVAVINKSERTKLQDKRRNIFETTLQSYWFPA